jgi:hypothetical protein
MVMDVCLDRCLSSRPPQAPGFDVLLRIVLG